MNERKVFSLLLLAQTAGIAFYVVVFLAYSLGLPSTDNLIGDPTFRLLLQLFGGLFLILIGSALAAIVLANKRRVAEKTRGDKPVLITCSISQQQS